MERSKDNHSKRHLTFRGHLSPMRLDLAGPLRVPTIGGNRFLWFAVDCKTLLVVVKALRLKGQQIGKLVPHLAWSKAQTGTTCKAIRTDGDWQTTELATIREQ